MASPTRPPPHPRPGGQVACARRLHHIQAARSQQRPPRCHGVHELALVGLTLPINSAAAGHDLVRDAEPIAVLGRPQVSDTNGRVKVAVVDATVAQRQPESTGVLALICRAPAGGQPAKVMRGMRSRARRERTVDYLLQGRAAARDNSRPQSSRSAAARDNSRRQHQAGHTISINNIEILLTIMNENITLEAC